MSDSDDDGSSSSSSSVANEAHAAERSDPALSLFRLIDEDESGFVTYAELRKVLRANAQVLMLIRRNDLLRPLLLPRIFQATSETCDLDSDSKLSLAEFRGFCDQAFEIGSIEAAAERIFRELRKENKRRRSALVGRDDDSDDSSDDDDDGGAGAARAAPSFSIKREDFQYFLYRSRKIVEVLLGNAFIIRMLQPRLFKTCFRKCGEFERAEGIPVRLDEFRRLCNHVSAVSKTLGPLSTKATWNANANAESFSALAASRFENGDFKGASSLYRTCIDIQPSNKVYHFALGAAEEASGDVEKAAAAYEMALEIDLKWRHPMDGLVRCLEAMHKERTRKGLLGKFLLF